MTVEITMLNAMASKDFGAALDLHAAWGVTLLDLKDAILGKDLLSLDDDEARRAAAMIRERALRVYCLSSGLFYADVEQGRERFTDGLGARVDRLVELARILQPQVVRLLAAKTSRLSTGSGQGSDAVDDAIDDIERRQLWLIEEYQRAIDCIAAAGFMATIENETHGCILSRPAEVLRLLRLIDRPGKVMFTWDVQNMWQCGTWPSVEVYEALRDVTGYLHLKGGQSETPGGPLAFRSRLEDSSYDVRGIVRAAVASGKVGVICLNPPHGKPKPGYDDTNRVERDLAFVRGLLAGQ